MMAIENEVAMTTWQAMMASSFPSMPTRDRKASIAMPSTVAGIAGGIAINMDSVDFPRKRYR